MPVFLMCMRRGPLAALALLLFTLSLFAAVPAWAQGAREGGAITTIANARFEGPDAVSSAQVSLPDTWVQRGLRSVGSGRYVLEFTLAARPAGPFGISFTRLSSTRRMTLNGIVIEDTREVGYEHPVRAVVLLPPLVLRPGVNELLIDVQHRVQGGLSQASLGPMATLQHEEARRELRIDELPRTLNMAMALLAVLMLLVRWLRPSERAMGIFGALALMASARNYSYFLEVSLMPVVVGDAFYFCAQVWTALLFAAFALALNPQRRPTVVDRVLLWSCAVVPVLALIASPLGWLTILRTVVYPFVLLGSLITLGLIWRVMRQDRSMINIALVIGFAALLVAGAHDYFYQQGMLPVTHMYWIPFAMPVAFGVFGLMQMVRFVRVMNEVEHLNLDLELRVQQRTRELQAANAAKSRFLAAASHDLRQPVAAIGLMVSLLREQLVAPSLRRLIDRVDEALASMEALLKGLLDLSRLESGTARPRIARVALQPLFDAIAVHESEVAALKGLRLRFRPTPLAVRSDPLLLEQILRNLISNALRYTEEGTVLVTARVRGDQVLLQVWDTGIGIAEQNQSIVFDEFVQLGNRARERAKGLGLGLSIVKRSAAVLGHTLYLRSRVGHGSCFSLRVPRADDVQAVLAPAPSAPLPLAGRRVIVVDDDPVVLESLAERMRAWGAEVRAFDGLPALRACLPSPGALPTSLQERCYADLLVTDQRMPGGSGLKVIELVREHCGPVPALVVTGDTSPEDLALFEQVSVPVLHKPFRTEALLAAISQVLEGAQPA